MEKSLESFIKQYLDNKKIASYKDWVALHGKDTDTAYAAATQAADTDYKNALATHGAQADALYEKGLSGSGYSDYLNASAYAMRAATKAKAAKTRAEDEKTNRLGFLSYLDSMEGDASAEEDTDLVDAYKSLLSQNILDEDTAYSYLRTLNVGEEDARRLAKESLTVQKNSSSRRSEVLSFTISKGLEYYSAYYYALTQGLSESVAREIASISAITARYYTPSKKSSD